MKLPPPTQYTAIGDLYIAYQVFGEGPFDLVFAPGWMSHVEQNWEWPLVARFFRRLSSFARVIIFDRRGTGLSDRPCGETTIEQVMEDIEAVMDAVGSERAALVGTVEGGPMCCVFAATYPERVQALVLSQSFARRSWAEDYPWGLTEEVHRLTLEAYRTRYGRKALAARILAPSLQGEDLDRFREYVIRGQRYAASPGAAMAWYRTAAQIDVRHVLPAIHVPTLVIQRKGDLIVNIGNAHYLAEHIDGAKLVEMEGNDHFPFLAGNVDEYLDEIEEFLTGSRGVTDTERALATVLFTDIVGSTTAASTLGDSRWRDVLDEHDAVMRRHVEAFRGRIIKSTGDGLLATFDGPARAIRCAHAINDGVRSLGIDVRTGLHSGEIELRDSDIGGIAVHIAARVCALAHPGEVLTSRTVKDLVVGSGIGFTDRGIHTLKGIPDEWQLFSADRG